MNYELVIVYFLKRVFTIDVYWVLQKGIAKILKSKQRKLQLRFVT